VTKKLYVGNLPFSTVEEDVYDLFEAYGDIVSVAMINDRETGRFRGFCFVEIEGSAAEAAIEALDGKDFNGRNLRVNEARPREDRGGGGNRGGGYRGGGNRGGGNRGGGYRGGDRDGGDRRW